jgi:hypothetical protein
MIAKFGRPKIVQFPFKIIFRYCANCPRFSYLQMAITRCTIWHNCTLYTVNYEPHPCKYTMQKYLASHRVAGNNINVTGVALLNWQLYIMQTRSVMCTLTKRSTFMKYFTLTLSFLRARGGRLTAHFLIHLFYQGQYLPCGLGLQY